MCYCLGTCVQSGLHSNKKMILVFAILRKSFTILRRMKSQATSSPPARPVIGLVMDYFNPQLLEGARTYAGEHGVQLDARWSVRGDWLPTHIHWDGILHGLVDHPQTVKQIKKSNLPMIELASADSGCAIIPDYEACGKMAVDELLKVGIQHLCTVNISSRLIDEAFKEGAIAHAKNKGLSYSEYHWQPGDFRKMIDDIVQLICSLPKPLGLGLPHAAVAHSIINTLVKTGLRIPEDVRIVVIDKDPQKTSALAPVSLTGVTLNEWHRGFIAAETMHQMILGKTPKRSITVIPPRSIHGRASTGHVETHDPVMAKALTYLRANYINEIGVPEVVTASGASRRTLEMRFREMLDCTIHEELRRLRIDDAKHHLEKEKLSITDIAQICGFSSVHYFSGAFKRETGISPRLYQQSVK